jgi:hypothetical protein
VSGLRCRFIVLVCVASSSMFVGEHLHAQSPALTGVHAKRELTLKGTPGELDILRKVPTASGFAAVVSDAAGALVVAHAPQPTYTQALPEHFPIADDPDVTVYRLDAQGEVGAAAPIRLPRAAKLAARRQYPLSVAVHPKLPLLYVWQDVVAPAEKAPPDDQATDGFKHLHLYDLSVSPPKLLQSACHGESFSRGNAAAVIGLDRAGSRLFIPNMQRRTKTGLASMIGYLKLAADGKVADDTPAAYAAAAKVSLYGESPCGLGYYDVSDTVTILCAGLGPCTWDEQNRRAQLNVLTFFPSVGAGYRYRMAVNPTTSTVYLTGLGSSNLYRVEHVDGFFTMWPQRALFDGGLLITSPPVVVGKRPLVACSTVGFVHLVKLDAEGYFTGERTDIALTSRKVEALAYSAKYDRLYATYEEVKK